MRKKALDLRPGYCLKPSSMRGLILVGAVFIAGAFSAVGAAEIPDEQIGLERFEPTGDLAIQLQAELDALVALANAPPPTSNETLPANLKQQYLLIVTPGGANLYPTEQLANLVRGEAFTEIQSFANLAESRAALNPYLGELVARTAALLVFFTGSDVIAGLDSASIEQLKTLSSAGATIAVNNADGSALAAILGIPSNRDLSDDLISFTATPALYVVNKLRPVRIPSANQNPAELLGAIGAWLEKLAQDAASRDGTSLWGNRVEKRLQHIKPAEISFVDVVTTMQMSKLNDASPIYDFYRFDFFLRTNPKQYQCKDWTFYCGWYTKAITFRAWLFADADAGLQVRDQAPLNQSDQSSFTLGASISVDAGSPTAGLSFVKTYTVNDVDIKDNTTDSGFSWDLDFRAADLLIFPTFELGAPGNVATGTYDFPPSGIVRVAHGKSGQICLFQLTTFRKDNAIVTLDPILSPISYAIQYAARISKNSAVTPLTCYQFGPSVF